jgi:undecaprenyl-diphosphatase
MTNDPRSVAKACAWAISFLALFVILSLAVSKGITGGVDSAVRSSAHQAASPPLTASMDLATRLGSASLLTLLFLACFLCLYLGGLRRNAWTLAIAMAGAVVVENALKFLVHRARPEPFFGIAAPETYSFPSGHTLFSTCFYGVIAWSIADHFSGNLSRAAIWVSAAVIIVIVGYSRVYLGVHYPTDVLGGLLAAASWLCAVRAGTKTFFV